MKVIEFDPLTTGRVSIPGHIELAFYLDARWPNELGERPDDLLGRWAKQGDDYFRIVSREGTRFIVVPAAKVPVSDAPVRNWQEPQSPDQPTH